MVELPSNVAAKSHRETEFTNYRIESKMQKHQFGVKPLLFSYPYLCRFRIHPPPLNPGCKAWI